MDLDIQAEHVFYRLRILILSSHYMRNQKRYPFHRLDMVGLCQRDLDGIYIYIYTEIFIEG
jgi:hypothetical protein